MTLPQFPADLKEPEIVRWLRDASPFAKLIPVPKARDPHRSYTRTLIHRCEQFEILVLHWTPGSVTAIHDHGGALCWLAVADGEVGVENFKRCDTGSTPGYARIAFDGRESLCAGRIDYRQDDLNLHRCLAHDAPAVTLHVYAHPIERFHAFDERAERCTEVTTSYDAVLTNLSV